MRPTNAPRRAFTLVEAIAATAMLAVLTTASFTLIRTANSAWLRHRDDAGRRREAVVAVQHIMRRVRQAYRVTAISAASDASGSLTLVMPGNVAATWDHNAGTNQLLYGASAATSLLATGISEFSLLGLKADGATPTTETDLIHAVKCTIKYPLQRPAGAVVETLSSTSWLRAW
jgi:hypothetical protein